MAKTAGQAGSALVRQEIVAGSGTFAIGDLVAFAIRMRVNAQEDQTGATAGVLLEFRNDTAALSVVNVYSAGGAMLDGIGYMEAIVPAGTTRIRVTATFDGTPAVDSWVRYAQPTFLNLTKLGIA